MKSEFCMLCHWYCGKPLCNKHNRYYKWDSSIQGFRLKKNGILRRLQIWKSENFLSKILEKAYGRRNIVRGFHPKWALSPTGVLYEYDILIKNKDILIEYNGQQHYKFIKFFHRNKKEFSARVEHDGIKARLAKENGYNLLVFRYDEPLFKDYVIHKIEGNV